MKQVNIDINDGQEFFAHEVSINYTPTQFVLDFKSITPRVDPRSKDSPTFSLKHNVVMLDVWNAKQFLAAIGKAVEQYEKQFGQVEIPKALQKAAKNRPKAPAKAAQSTPSYFG